MIELLEEGLGVRPRLVHGANGQSEAHHAQDALGTDMQNEILKIFLNFIKLLFEYVFIDVFNKARELLTLFGEILLRLIDNVFAHVHRFLTNRIPIALIP